MKIFGSTLDSNTRCKHWNSKLDIIAIKFACCQKYYPCYLCHKENENHKIKQWNKDERAILCGICKYDLLISQYINCNNKCPYCKSDFNSNCQKHYLIYFDKILLEKLN
ncbi:MAG: hypothetical protein GY830_03750 [Bacteroidetes bacterium]|nr:hypothetical protein [Bacteroidota bacterium]